MTPVTPFIVVEPPNLPYTRVRCLEVEAAPGSHRITGIGRADILIFSDGSLLPLPPQQLMIDPMQQQARGVVPCCTPLNIAQAIWTREPPGVVCSHGARTWELVAPVAAGLARMDTSKLAMLVWPSLACHSLEHVCRSVSESAAARHGLEGLTPLQLRLVQGQMLVMQLYARGARLLELQPIARPPDRSWVGSCLGYQAGDPILQAATDLSLLSMPPARDPRPDWDQPDAWLQLANEELDYVCAAPGTTPEALAAATAECRRRDDARRAASVGLTLTRRPAPGGQDIRPST